MGSEELLEKLRGYLSVDQEFYHHTFMRGVKRIEHKEDLLEIIDLVHSNYLIRTKLFSNLARRVAQDGYKLPPLNEIIDT